MATGIVDLGVAGATVPSTASAFARLQRTNGTNLAWLGLLFKNAVVQSAAWQFIAPKNWDAAGVTVRARWISSATTGNVKWSGAGLGKPDATTWDAAFTGVDAADSAAPAAGKVKETSWTMTAAQIGWTAGSDAQFRLQRVAASASEMAADAELVGLSIEYGIA